MANEHGYMTSLDQYDAVMKVYDAAMAWKNLKNDAGALRVDVEWAEIELLDACHAAEGVKRG